MFLDSTSLVGPGVVALSGGPDSVALAHACVQLHRTGTLDAIVLAHLNHCLRGTESDADEAFVQQLATTWQVPCITKRTDVAAIAQEEGDNLESIARRERYAWLTTVATDRGLAWVATGHTADDQAETVLFRILRGAGVVGLRGIAARRPLAPGVDLIRPLLGLRRQVLLDYLEANQLAFCTDSSNRDLRLARNRIRHELLPHLAEEYNPGVVDVLCRLAEQAEESAEQIETQADRLLAEAELPRAGATLVFSIERLQQASANLVREMFRRVWRRESWPTGNMDFVHWQRLVNVVAGLEPARDFPNEVRVRRVAKVLQITRTGYVYASP